MNTMTHEEAIDGIYWGGYSSYTHDGDDEMARLVDENESKLREAAKAHFDSNEVEILREAVQGGGFINRWSEHVDKVFETTNLDGRSGVLDSEGHIGVAEYFTRRAGI